MPLSSAFCSSLHITFTFQMCLLCPFYTFFFTLFMQVTVQKPPAGWRRFLLCYQLRKCSVHDIIKLAGKIPFSFLVSKCNPGKTTGNFPCILPSPLTPGFYFYETSFFFFFTCGTNLKYKLITCFDLLFCKAKNNTNGKRCILEDKQVAAYFFLLNTIPKDIM